MSEIQLREMLMDELPDRDYTLVFAGKTRTVSKEEYIDHIVMLTEFITDVEPN